MNSTVAPRQDSNPCLSRDRAFAKSIRQLYSKQGHKKRTRLKHRSLKFHRILADRLRWVPAQGAEHRTLAEEMARAGSACHAGSDE
jgi:hypothetical protein